MNRFSNTLVPDYIYPLQKGDVIYGTEESEEFGFTIGNQYEVEGIATFGYLILTNDKGETDSYVGDYFRKFKEED